MQIKGKLLLENVNDPVAREVWLEAKAQTIGSSEIAVIMGASPFSTVNDLYKEKQTGTRTFEGNNATKWGNLLEPLIFQAFLEESGFQGKQPHKMYCDINHEWATCSPDGFLFDVNGPAGQQYGLCEIKNVSAFKSEEWLVSPPTYYWMQVQWQLGIMGLSWAFLVAKIDNELVYHKIFFDEKWYAEALETAEDFLTAVKTNTTFSRKFEPRDMPKKGNVEIVLNADESQYVHEYISIENEIKELNKHIKPLEERKKKLADEFSGLTPNGGTLKTFDGTSTVKISFSPVNVKAYSYEKRTVTARTAK